MAQHSIKVYMSNRDICKQACPQNVQLIIFVCIIYTLTAHNIMLHINYPACAARAVIGVMVIGAGVHIYLYQRVW